MVIHCKPFHKFRDVFLHTSSDYSQFFDVIALNSETLSLSLFSYNLFESFVLEMALIEQIIKDICTAK